jgi:hypothetical protein
LLPLGPKERFVCMTRHTHSLPAVNSTTAIAARARSFQRYPDHKWQPDPVCPERGIDAFAAVIGEIVFASTGREESARAAKGAANSLVEVSNWLADLGREDQARTLGHLSRTHGQPPPYVMTASLATPLDLLEEAR